MTARISLKQFCKMNTDQLGVGILYNASLPGYLEQFIDNLDYIEIIPDMFWSDEGREQQPRFTPLPKWMQQLDWIAERVPLVAHNVGISIGSMDVFDIEYIRYMQQMHAVYQFKWH